MAKANDTSTGFRLFSRAREVVVFTIFLLTVVGAAIMSWVAVRDDLHHMHEAIERVRLVQNFQMLEARHHGDVLEHVAAKQDGAPPPAKPAKLVAAELELMQ